MIRFALCAGWMLALYAFIFLPVAVLALFSFQDGRFPTPPFRGFTLRWHAEVFSDAALTGALINSAGGTCWRCRSW